MKQRIIYLTFLFTLLFTSHTIWATSAVIAEAESQIKETTTKMLDALKKEKNSIKSNPSRLYDLVNDIVLPYFDFSRMSQYVLGKNWKEATKEQKDRFIEAFRDLLVRTYATSLTEAAENEVKVEYLPTRAKEGDQRITIQTEVSFQDKTLAVSYGLFFKEKWRVWNVTVEGASLVDNYRQEFNEDVATVGIDGLIEKIEARNQEARQGK